MKFISWTNPVLGSRNEQSTNAFHHSELVAKQANPKRQRSLESPHRKLWKMAETVFARIEVLEHLDQDHSHGERLRSGSPDNITSLPKEKVNRPLYKTLETALTRISVLEKRRDISYDHAFKASNGKQCMIRGCGSELSRPNHAIRHIKNTSTPEHQVATMVTMNELPVEVTGQILASLPELLHLFNAISSCPTMLKAFNEYRSQILHHVYSLETMDIYSSRGCDFAIAHARNILLGRKRRADAVLLARSAWQSLSRHGASLQRLLPFALDLARSYEKMGRTGDATTVLDRAWQYLSRHSGMGTGRL